MIFSYFVLPQKKYKRKKQSKLIRNLYILKLFNFLLYKMVKINKINL